MKIISVLLILMSISSVYADERTDEALRIYYGGDRAQGEALFRQIFAENPNNAEILWQLSYASFARDNVPITKYHKEIRKAANIAMQSGDEALANYILAQYASNRNQYSKSMQHIKRSIELDPSSIRYLRTKMVYLFARSIETRNYQLATEGLSVAEDALSKIEDDPKQYFTAGGIHFTIGRWFPNGTKAFKELRIGHFKKAIKAGGISDLTVSYAWNNMASALVQLGRCDEAKTAAKKALSTHDYGYARTNYAKANECLTNQSIVTVVDEPLSFIDTMFAKIKAWLGKIFG